MIYDELEDPLYVKKPKIIPKIIVAEEEFQRRIPKPKTYINEPLEETKNKPILFIGKTENEIRIPIIDYKPKGDAEEEECLPLQTNCGVNNYYGDASPEDYFVRKNLFSELVSDYQRAIARFNLGIGEEYSLVWGNITGSIANQEDLYELIENYWKDRAEDYNFDIHEFIRDLNKTLEDFIAEVNFSLRNKANIHSPKFTGEPTTTLPSIDSSDSRIPSTEWVDAKISMNESNHLRWVKLTPNFMYTNDLPKTVTISWEFYHVVSKIWIEGQLYIGNGNSYTFAQKFYKDEMIHFSYEIEDKIYNKFITFQLHTPYYYGTTEINSPMFTTHNSDIIVDSGKNYFVYLYLPKENARISVDNIYGGFERLSTTFIGGTEYYRYQTVNSGLGLMHINYDK